MAGNRRPTIKTVAARAGVGRTTVSRVVNGSHLVSADARTRVLAAIKELNYVPNSVARGLVTSRTDAVALVIPESASRLGSEPFFAALIRGVSQALADRRTQLQLMLVRDQAEREQLTESVAERRVDGVLLVSVHSDDPLPAMLEEMGLPTVLAGRRDADERLSYVHADNAGGATEAVRHLLRSGRKKVATIAGPLDMDVGRSRLDGWRTAHEEDGLSAPETLVEVGDFSWESGSRAMRSLLERAPDLDAVFAASDLMAIGALEELRRQKRQVPGDVAVVGFEDSPHARWTNPPLTTVRQPVEELGSTMVRILADITEAGAERQQLMLPTELVVRESSGGPGI
ncbi:LacI family DNA-binding transcriptional regulator [Streptomyces sp. HUAS 31]|uniref:LacI family DNA-binding transcriptional regulator n=1 Tax=Streptomyces sp. HUAS 31 TaxID=3020055 RepID=UPI002305EACF|nr:LacI family DNA-binding transcriptional regulator [Streptomyces sp. HUAS 31]WCD94252.1 LacI family DNA-binding transcriptional regulator [Streptomyces sp. HUAS 31]